MAKEDIKKKMLYSIRENYRQVEQSIVNQLYMRNELHGTTTGSAREDIWRQLFEMIIPKKFVIEQSVFIIDSEGNVSNEVDLAILDETYTPYIFRYGRLKFIPIEAVAVVVECKSESLDDEGIKNWCNRISALQTNKDSIARMATNITIGAPPTQQSTRPIRILCRVGTTVNKEITEYFDFVLLAKKETKNKKSRIEVKASAAWTLLEWFGELNFRTPSEFPLDINEAKRVRCKLKDINLSDYEVYDSSRDPISLLTFNFQLNQLLMLINNPMLFPHRAYAKLFNEMKG